MHPDSFARETHGFSAGAGLIEFLQVGAEFNHVRSGTIRPGLGRRLTDLRVNLAGVDGDDPQVDDFDQVGQEENGGLGRVDTELPQLMRL
ncbi:hypothetical protein D3C80_1681120 [compost metagenome]